MARNAARFARPLARPPAARFSRSLEGLPAARFARRLTAPPHPLDGAPDLVERFGILERREVAGILAERSGPDGAPDDLRAPSLGKRGDKDHTLGPEGLPELVRRRASDLGSELLGGRESGPKRSEEHTSELQSHSDLVCRLLLEKKKNTIIDFVAGNTSEATAEDV